MVKMDMFEKRYAECVEQSGFLDTLSSVAKLVSGETVEAFALSLVAAHKPHVCDFAARFGITASAFPNPTKEKAPAPAVKMCCEKCNAAVDAQVVKYCRTNLQRFRGQVLCRSCQTAAPTGTKCSDCGCAVDQKVAAYCRFNSKRFGKKVFCRTCQSKAGAQEFATA